MHDLVSVKWLFTVGGLERVEWEIGFMVSCGKRAFSNKGLVVIVYAQFSFIVIQRS